MSKSWRSGCAAATVAAAALATACGPASIPPAFQEQAVQESEYRIAPADELEIRVWKNPELSILGPVLPDGTISVPLAGVVTAKDLTAGELEDVIASRLTDYITAPEVSVVVRQVNSKRVSVIGEVQRSGSQSLAVNARVMDALAAAGGFTPYANKRKIKVIRYTPEGEVSFRFSYPAFNGGGAPGTNVLLQPGDVIVVPD
jgi:polysaccharide export outer membrane protein